jgi:hypothetical protein
VVDLLGADVVDQLGEGACVGEIAVVEEEAGYSARVIVQENAW